MNRVIIQDPAGNVGIGMTDPAFRLDVNGDANIGGPLSVRGILSVTETNIIQVMGTNILTMWPHGNMVTNLNADRVDGKHANELGGVIDHGTLLGLADDDHTQYHNDTRGDTRYAGAGWDTTTTLKTAQDHIASTDNPHSLTWEQLKAYGMPTGFADNVDDVGGGITEEHDPQVGANTPNYVPRWDGPAETGALVKGSIYDPGSGNISIPGSFTANGAVYALGNVYAHVIQTIVADTPWGYQQNLTLRAADDFTVLVPGHNGFRVPGYDGGHILILYDKYPDAANAGDLYIRGYLTEGSDSRVKLNQQPLDYGLTQVLELEPKRYDRTDLTSDDESSQIEEGKLNDIGLIAQEVYEVIPEAVRIPEDETHDLWSISYSKIVPVLVKAIQEQQAEIKELQQENQILKSESATVTPLTADFDADGKADTAIVDTYGNWYFQLSGSGFVKSGPYNFGVTGKPMADDFDGDGKADPAMVDSSGNCYVWLSASGYSQRKL